MLQFSPKSKGFQRKKTLNLKGNIYSWSETQVMGIINLTPDSFYDGNQIKNTDDLFRKVEKMLTDGADWVDIGGCSTRPGAEIISVEEELKRVIEPIEKIANKFDGIKISIDTFQSKVAKEAIQAGAMMVNDVSGGNFDSEMFIVVAQNQVPYILMHSKGTSKNMQELSQYNSLLKEISFDFSKKIYELNLLNINDIILDPGIGFAKTIDQNFEIMKNIPYIVQIGQPVMIGISRKSMIYKTLQITSEQALNGTSVLNTWAIFNGVDFLRVHDVKEAKEAVKLCNLLMN